MKVRTALLNKILEAEPDSKSDLVLCAFDRTNATGNMVAQLEEKFPNAKIVMFSTSGHFFDGQIHETSPIVVSIQFEKSSIQVKEYKLGDFEDSLELGKQLGTDFSEELKGLCILSDGSEVNGTRLIQGVNESMHQEVPVFGGMAGDGTRFEQTLIGLNDQPTTGRVVGIGFYGDSMNISGACNAGWSSLGMEFKITRSNKNKLLELDGKNSYEVLYELLKPENKDDFTKNTLYFPFQLEHGDGTGVIRTPVAVDHEGKTLTYAGDMPVGSKVKLMRSSTLQLLESTLEAAQESATRVGGIDFVFAVSCVGRRVVLDRMASEEFTEINSVFGEQPKYFGFYSYGEFFRSMEESHCLLHNQTFTLTVLSED